MANSMETPIPTLDALLEEERTALLNGQLDRVGKMLAKKTRLVENLNEQRAEPDEVKALKAKVSRNQQLLQGSLEGVRRVAERLEALRRVRDRLDTYGADGKRKEVATDRPSSVERRA